MKTRYLIFFFVMLLVSCWEDRETNGYSTGYASIIISPSFKMNKEISDKFKLLAHSDVMIIQTLTKLSLDNKYIAVKKIRDKLDISILENGAIKMKYNDDRVEAALNFIQTHAECCIEKEYLLRINEADRKSKDAKIVLNQKQQELVILNEARIKATMRISARNFYPEEESYKKCEDQYAEILESLMDYLVRTPGYTEAFIIHQKAIYVKE